MVCIANNIGKEKNNNDDRKDFFVVYCRGIWFGAGVRTDLDGRERQRDQHKSAVFH